MARIRTELDGVVIEVEAEAMEDAMAAYAKLDTRQQPLLMDKLCLSLGDEAFCVWVSRDIDPGVLTAILDRWEDGDQ